MDGARGRSRAGCALLLERKTSRIPPRECHSVVFLFWKADPCMTDITEWHSLVLLFWTYAHSSNHSGSNVCAVRSGCHSRHALPSPSCRLSALAAMARRASLESVASPSSRPKATTLASGTPDPRPQTPDSRPQTPDPRPQTPDHTQTPK